MVNRPTKPALSTEAGLRHEIEHLRQLIDSFHESAADEQHDRWYLNMLQQALTRKTAALGYIVEHDASRNRPFELPGAGAKINR